MFHLYSVFMLRNWLMKLRLVKLSANNHSILLYRVNNDHETYWYRKFIDKLCVSSRARKIKLGLLFCKITYRVNLNWSMLKFLRKQNSSNAASTSSSSSKSSSNELHNTPSTKVSTSVPDLKDNDPQLPSAVQLKDDIWAHMDPKVVRFCKRKYCWFFTYYTIFNNFFIL